MRKISIGLIIVLVVVIAAEILFYFNMVRSKNTVAVDQIPKQLPSPSPTLVQKRTDEVVHTSYTPAISADQIDWLRRSRDTGHVKTTLRQEFEGVVFKIQRMRYETEIGQLTGYNIVLTTNNITDEYKMNIFAITDNQQNVVQVNEQKLEKTEPMSITDVKVGDTIRVVTETDLSKQFGENLMLATILRLEK